MPGKKPSQKPLFVLPEQKISDAKYSKHDEIQRSSKMFTLELIPEHEILRILDIGCGTGLNTKYIVKLGHSVVGVDISRVALERYSDRGFNGIRCDINKGLPFRDASFDMLFASEVLEHLHDTGFFLSESYRVLKPQGTFLLSTPNSAFWPFRILSAVGKTVSELQHPGHIRFFSKKTLSGFVTQCGFVINGIYGRHMHVLLGDAVGKFLKPFLLKTGFQREYRFSTSKYFWHRSRFSSRASEFWADTLILKATKPDDES